MCEVTIEKKKDFSMSSVDQNQSLRPYYQTVLLNVHWSVLEIYSFFLMRWFPHPISSKGCVSSNKSVTPPPQVSFYLLQTRNKIGIHIFPYIWSLGLLKTVSLHVRSLCKENNPILLKFKRGSKLLLRRNHSLFNREARNWQGRFWKRNNLVT